MQIKTKRSWVSRVPGPVMRCNPRLGMPSGRDCVAAGVFEIQSEENRNCGLLLIMHSLSPNTQKHDALPTTTIITHARR